MKLLIASFAILFLVVNAKHLRPRLQAQDGVLPTELPSRIEIPVRRELVDNAETTPTAALLTPRMEGEDLPEGGCERITDMGVCQRYGNCLVVRKTCKHTTSRYLKVLFIGNSFTSTNSMTNLFRLVSTKKGKLLRVAKVTHGGATIQSHLASSSTMAKLRSQQWDVVIVQEQSAYLSYPFDKYYPVQHALSLKQAVEAQGGLMVLYQTWGYRFGHANHITGMQDNYYLMQERIRQGYSALSSALDGVTVIPAGTAWEHMLATRGDDELGLVLYTPDLRHPRKTGSYVVACTIFAEIFGETAVGARGFRGIKFAHRKAAAVAATRAVGL